MVLWRGQIRVSCPNYTQAHAERQTGKLCGGSERLIVSMPDKRSEGRKTGWGLHVRLSVIGSLLLSFGHATSQSLTDALKKSPRDWIVDTAGNEIEVLQRSDIYLRYRMHVVDQKGDQVRDVIESKDGTVARLILRDGRPLTAEEDAAERERLNDIMASPERYAKHVKNDAEGKKLAADLIRQMPDAMIYTYTPGQPQKGHDEGSGEVVLDYYPNPKWSAPSTMSEGLTGLEGRIWIDVKTHQMLRMEGHIFKPINFGWGMLAHIYPGGQLTLEQTAIGGQRWIYTHFIEQVSVRAVMVKTMNVHTQVDAFGFQVLPGAMSYQEAIRLLLATPLPTH
jgi:hypothetical protein